MITDNGLIKSTPDSVHIRLLFLLESEYYLSPMHMLYDIVLLCTVISQ